MLFGLTKIKLDDKIKCCKIYTLAISKLGAFIQKLFSFEADGRQNQKNIRRNKNGSSNNETTT